MKKLILAVFSLSFILCACSRPQTYSVLISAGGNHTCALSGDGRVRCWGSNEKGQLGNGTSTNSPTPVAVKGLGNDIIALAAGGRHTCALSSKGRVRCWGSNEQGQLGDGASANSPQPVDVSGLTNSVAAIAAGDEFTCALGTEGRVQCWGSNQKGQLGNGASANSPLPVDVSGLKSVVIAIAAGGQHACALTEGGGVKCWGANGFGQIGDKTKKDRPTPVDVSGLGKGVAAITAGGGHTCALTSIGGVKCWGWNGDEAGNHYVPKPENVDGLGSGVTIIAAGEEHTCALVKERVKCWGSNYVGQLGSESLPGSSIPVEVSSLGNGMLAIATGGYHTCVLSETASVVCWGQNYHGELGNASKPYSAAPVSVTDLKTITFASLTATAAPKPKKAHPTLIPWPTPTPLSTLQPGQPVSLSWLHMLDAGIGWGIDISGHILRTTDGGGSWRCVTPPEGAYEERSFFIVDANNAWAAFLPVMPGSEGCDRVANCHLTARLWRTSDGGVTWRANKTWDAAQPLARPGDGGAADGPSSAKVHGLHFVDPATGWLLLEDWTADTDILTVLARTTDSGQSLREIWRSSGFRRFTGAAFINRQVGYLGVDETTFFDRLDGLPALKDYVNGKQTPYLQKTSDGGKTWETMRLPKLSPIPESLQALASSGERMLCGIKKLKLIPSQGIAAKVTCRVTGGFGPFSFDYFSPDGGENWHSWIADDRESFISSIVN